MGVINQHTHNRGGITNSMKKRDINKGDTMGIYRSEVITETIGSNRGKIGIYL